MHKSLFNKIGIPRIIASLLVLVVIFLTIGFSAFQSELNISSKAIVRIDKDIRITSATVHSQANSATSSYTNYNVSTLYTDIDLPNSNSSIEYEIKIRNLGNVEQGILSYSGLPSNLKITQTDYTLQDKLCDSDNPNICTLTGVTTYYLTIQYDTNGYNSLNTEYSIDLEFNFELIHDVYYNGVKIDYIINGGTKSFNLGNNSTSNVNVTGTYTNQSYSNHTVTITGATSNIQISDIFNIYYNGTQFQTVTYGGNKTLSLGAGATSNVSVTGVYTSKDDSNLPTLVINGITSDIYVANIYTIFVNASAFDTANHGTNKTINLNDNNITSVSLTGTYSSYDDTNLPYLTINGITTDIYVTTVSGSGGGTWDEPVIDNTTLVYNPDPTNATVGTTQYDAIEGSPKVTVEEDGNGNKVVTEFGYADPGSGITFSNNKTVDTGVIPFAGAILNIHLKFDMAVTGNNVGKYVLTAMQKVGTQGNSNLYGGFIWFFRKSSEFDLYSSQSNTIKSGWFGSSIYQISMTANSNVATYTVDMSYDGDLRKVTYFKFQNSTQTAKSSTYFPASPFNATITLGGVGVENDHSRDVNNMVVKEFWVRRTAS